jgi:hypothetical protein
MAHRTAKPIQLPAQDRIDLALTDSDHEGVKRESRDTSCIVLHEMFAAS